MTPATDSPQTRLAASREALVRQMTGDVDPSGHGTRRDFDDTADQNTNAPHNSTWQVLKQAVMAWWQQHPAQVAVDIGRPFLSNYARDKPFQLLGIAAGAGAIAVLVRPWRLVSITGLAVAALKSTRLSSTLLSLIPRAASPSSASSPRSPNRTQPMKDTP